MCSSTSATTRRARTSSRSSRSWAARTRLGGFHFNNRKYADDDLIVGSVNPFELFLIFCELVAQRPAAAAPDDRPGAQRRGEGRGDGAERRQPAGGATPRRCSSIARRWRPRSAPATCSAATSCCSTPTRPTCGRCAPRSASTLGAAEDPIAGVACLRLRRADRRRARWQRRRSRAGGADEHAAPDRRDRRGPLAGRAARCPTTRSTRSLLASHLLGADRAVANFGGGNTSAKGIGTDHLGRELDVMWVKGSGSDLATMGRGDFTALRLDEIVAAVRARRDERRGHGRPPRALPARPGRAALLDRDAAARVHPGRARPPHAPRRDQRARRRRQRRGAARRECFGDDGRLDPVHPARVHARQAGRRAPCAPIPALRLVVLAKHGLVVWGDTAEEAYRRTIEVINRAVDVRQRARAGRAALRRSGGRRATRGRRHARDAPATRSCP